MIYSEKWLKYYKAFTYFFALVITGAAFGISMTHKLEANVVCIMNTGFWYDIFVTGPYIFFVI